MGQLAGSPILGRCEGAENVDDMGENVTFVRRRSRVTSSRKDNLFARRFNVLRARSRSSIGERLRMGDARR